MTRENSNPGAAGARTAAARYVLQPEMRGDVLLLTVAPWRNSMPKLRAAFSTRLGGTSPTPYESLNLSRRVGDAPERVRANQDRFFTACDIKGPIHTVQQVHGTRIVQVPAHPDGREPAAATPTPAEHQIFDWGEADGVITDTPDQFLMVSYADCSPLLMVAPSVGVVAAVHAGWRGALSGVGRAAVHAFEGLFGVAPDDIHVVVGPSIGPCCLKVDASLVSTVWQFAPNAREVLSRGDDGKPYLDLWRTNAQVLEAAGIPARQILQSGICTACRPEWFFSHRRDESQTGRHALLAGWA